MNRVDEKNLTIRVSGSEKLQDVEKELRNQGLTLGPIAAENETVGEFIEGPLKGLRAVRFGRVEPIDLSVEAAFFTGQHLKTHDSPRQAMGPDLMALLRGMNGQLGHISAATLRVYANDFEFARYSISSADKIFLFQELRRCLHAGIQIAKLKCDDRSIGVEIFDHKAMFSESRRIFEKHFPAAKVSNEDFQALKWSGGFVPWQEVLTQNNSFSCISIDGVYASMFPSQRGEESTKDDVIRELKMTLQNEVSQ